MGDPDEIQTKDIKQAYPARHCLPSVCADIVLLGVKPFSLQTRRNVFTRQLNRQLQGSPPDETGWQLFQTKSTGNRLIATLAGKEITTAWNFKEIWTSLSDFLRNFCTYAIRTSLFASFPTTVSKLKKKSYKHQNRKYFRATLLTAISPLWKF